MNYKVGILTFVKVENYGAELQAFALQNTLNLLGYNSEIINFSIKKANYKGFESLYHSSTRDYRVRIHSLINTTVSYIMRIIHYRRYSRRRDSFEMFYRDYLQLSDIEYKSFSELCESEFDYSHVIVGSDQVWNYSMKFSVLPFLLSFIGPNVKKISYAASIGMTQLVHYLKPVYAENLSRFESISTREQSGANIISNLLNIDIPVVLDPTLLVSKDNWHNLLNVKVTENNYILIYMLTYSDELLCFAERLSAHTGLIVIQIMPSFFSYSWKRNGFRLIYDASPKDFVELIYNASYVLTTSFHGTAFAVNFQKPFYTFVNSVRKNNSRMLELLTTLNLDDRIIWEKQKPEINHFLSFDSHKAASKLEDLKEYSIHFLKSSLK